MHKRIAVILLCFFSIIHDSFAENASIGTGLTLPLIDKDPSHLKGYRLSLWYQPQQLIWKKLRLYFDGSLGHWWINQSNVPNKVLTIYSLAPVLRFYTKTSAPIAPFFEISIGVSYLSKTHFDSRNLGMHFSFQDQVGIGALFGPEKRMTASLSTMHYSNGSVGTNNSGITIPLLLNVTYRF